MHLQEIFDLTLVKVTWSIALYIMWPTYLQSLKLLLPMVKEKHLQENTLFDLDTLGSRSHEMLPSTLYIMWPMHRQSSVLLHPTVKEKMHLQENTLFDLDLGVKLTVNIAKCPPHHVTYAPTNFEVATSKG